MTLRIWHSLGTQQLLFQHPVRKILFGECTVQGYYYYRHNWCGDWRERWGAAAFWKNNEDHHNYFDIMDKLDIHKSKREKRAFERLFFWYIRVDCEFWAWFGRWYRVSHQVLLGHPVGVLFLNLYIWSNGELSSCSV